MDEVPSLNPSLSTRSQPHGQPSSSCSMGQGSVRAHHVFEFFLLASSLLGCLQVMCHAPHPAVRPLCQVASDLAVPP